jgi:hypothetical protein
MESRLMLSATSPELQVVGFHAIEFSSLNSQSAYGVEQKAFSPPANDGGFINVDSFDTVPRSNTQYGSPVGLDYSASANDAVKPGQLFVDANNAWTQSGSVAVDYDGLHPVTIVLSNNGGGLESAAPPLMRVPDTTSTPGEGGSISIPNLLTGLRHEQQLASAEKSIRQLAAESIGATRPLSNLPAQSDRAISGELARATVFEMVGGEPDASDRPGWNDRSENSTPPAALSEQEPISADAHEAAMLVASDTSGELHKNSPDFAISQQHVSQPIVDAQSASPTAAAYRSGVLGPSDHPASPTFLSSVMKSDDGTETVGPMDSNGVALASAAAFDELGQAVPANIESRMEVDRWLRPSRVTPLLVVLALERIAAINARHSARQTPVAPGRKFRNIIG